MIDEAYNRVLRGFEDQAKTDLRIIKESAKITNEFDHTQRQLNEREHIRNKEHTIKLRAQIQEQRKVRQNAVKEEKRQESYLKNFYVNTQQNRVETPELSKRQKEAARQLRLDLEEQINDKRDSQQVRVNRAKEEGRKDRERFYSQEKTRLVAQQERRQIEQEDLKKNWEREIKAKKLQNSIDKTVSEYHRKLQDSSSFASSSQG